MMFQAVLGNPGHPEYGVATIPFPIPHDQYAHCMELLEALEMSLLMDYTARPGNVADPWYTEDFEVTWQDVLEGCQGLLKEFMTERGDSNGTKR